MDTTTNTFLWISKCSPPEVFIGKGVLKMCSKVTGEHPCQSVISTKLQRNFIEIFGFEIYDFGIGVLL